MVSGAAFGQGALDQSTGLFTDSFGSQSMRSLISKGSSQMSKKKKKVFYLEPHWLTGTIFLDETMKMSEYPFKYNAMARLFEIKTKDEIKILSDSRVEAFKWTDLKGIERKYVSVRNIEQSYQMNGFFEVVVTTGELSLLKYKEIEMIESNYNIALSNGSKERSYTSKDKFYVLSKKSLKEIKRKKDLYKMFGEAGVEMGLYIKNGGFSVRNEADLVNILNHYNFVVKK